MSTTPSTDTTDTNNTTFSTKTITDNPTLDNVKKNWSVDVAKSGEFQRRSAVFRSFIKAVPAGSSAEASNIEFPAQKNRYHLYVSLACPWAHRTIILRALKGLQNVIGLTIVDYFLNREVGWAFTDSKSKCTLDPYHKFTHLRQIYQLGHTDYDGVISVPVLYDSVTDRIVNNESSEIIQMLNSEFNEFSETLEQASLDLYPESLRKEIDEVNDMVYKQINNGVYRSGFAQTQEAYEKAVHEVFDGLDKVEERLSKHRFLVGKQLTIADIRLFTTLIRFDPVYVSHFKCNIKQLAEYPNLFAYTRDIYQLPLIKETVDFEHIKNHYFQSHRHHNPYGIVPAGPIVDFDAPHNRSRFNS